MPLYLDTSLTQLPPLEGEGKDTVKTINDWVKGINQSVEKDNSPTGDFRRYEALNELLAASADYTAASSNREIHFKEWQEENNIEARLKEAEIFKIKAEFSNAQDEYLSKKIAQKEDKFPGKRAIEYVVETAKVLLESLEESFNAQDGGSQYFFYNSLPMQIKILQALAEDLLNPARTDVNLPSLDREYIETIKKYTTELAKISNQTLEGIYLKDPKALELMQETNRNKDSSLRVREFFNNITPLAVLGIRSENSLKIKNPSWPPTFKDENLGGKNNRVFLIKHETSSGKVDLDRFVLRIQDVDSFKDVIRRNRVYLAFTPEERKKYLGVMFGDFFVPPNGLIEATNLLKGSLLDKINNYKKANAYDAKASPATVTEIRDTTIYYLLESLKLQKTMLDRGIFFPDVKPGNYMIGADNGLVITDMKSIYTLSDNMIDGVTLTGAFKDPNFDKVMDDARAAYRKLSPDKKDTFRPPKYIEGLKNAILYSISVSFGELATGQLPEPGKPIDYNAPVFQGKDGKVLAKVLQGLANKKISLEDAIKKLAKLAPSLPATVAADMGMLAIASPPIVAPSVSPTKLSPPTRTRAEGRTDKPSPPLKIREWREQADPNRNDPPTTNAVSNNNSTQSDDNSVKTATVSPQLSPRSPRQDTETDNNSTASTGTAFKRAVTPPPTKRDRAPLILSQGHRRGGASSESSSSTSSTSTSPLISPTTSPRTTPPTSPRVSPPIPSRAGRRVISPNNPNQEDNQADKKEDDNNQSSKRDSPRNK